VRHTAALLVLCDPTTTAPGEGTLAQAMEAVETTYQELKATLIAAGAAGVLHLADMESALRRYSAMRRAAQQAAKARQRSVAAAVSPPGG